MAYTTINKHTDYFNTVLNTGDNTSPKAISGVGFQPDLVWTKSRTSGTTNHTLFDSVRGAGADKELSSNSTTAEGGNQSSVYGYLSSFDSDGFTATSGSSGANYFNQSGETYVNWNWLGANGTASNTDGSITSTVSANTTAGFSIVQYTGNSTSGATVGHGLGVVPKLIIVKTTARAGNWVMYHNTQGATKYLELNNTGALGTSTAAWNDTEPTSSVFSLGSWSNTNDNGFGMIAYCFAEKKGFSKFGSYTGNGNADGAFVYTGFKPAFILLKHYNASGNSWRMFDNKRLGYNVDNYPVNANTNSAESSSVNLDLLSNGFKFRTTSSAMNDGEYIYMAFGQSLVGSNNVPCTAR